jgi:hypothetical protein
MVAHVFLIDKIRLIQIMVNRIVIIPSLLSLHSYEHKLLMILYIVTFFSGYPWSDFCTMLTMTLGTAPPTQISDYEMVQLEHPTKLCHTRNKHCFSWGRVLGFGSYAPPDRPSTVVLSRSRRYSSRLWG